MEKSMKDFIHDFEIPVICYVLRKKNVSGSQMFCAKFVCVLKVTIF